MHNHLSVMLVLGAGRILTLTGCGDKNDPNAELQKAATAFEEPAPAPAPPPAPAPVQPQPQLQPASMPAGAPAPATEMNQAIAAYKGGQLEDAVIRLQRLRATPTMTPQQRMAVNDAMASVMSEIYDLAAKGDSRAIQAVKQYEQMQTQRR